VAPAAPEDDEEDDEIDDEVIVAQFKAPGARSVTSVDRTDPAKPT
jgi:hypothetical protein